MPIRKKSGDTRKYLEMKQNRSKPMGQRINKPQEKLPGILNEKKNKLSKCIT